MISPERLEQRQTGWVRLLEPMGVTPADAFPVFDQLVAAYREPHRAYHNLQHIDEVLRTVGRLRDFTREPAAVELAAWFHDAIYDPRATDNEARSADWAAEALAKLGVAATAIAAVRQLVLVTAHQTSGPLDRDAAVLLDADLAIFGAAEERYAAYARAIRQEYAWVADDAYRVGRARVLRHFLERNRIYRTERMYQQGEEAARRNLQRELETLT